jgi:GNAT superfamily N-acetyltransferase
MTVMVKANDDLTRRMGIPESQNIFAEPNFLQDLLQRRGTLFEFLAATAEQFWIAEEGDKIVGYARALMSDGVRELSEFFVLPELQGRGVGRELMARTFPKQGARRRVIMASTDTRAQVRYLKSGVYPRFAIQYLFRKPERRNIETDLLFKPAPNTPDTIAAMRTIDAAVLDFVRDEIHEFLLNGRKAYLYQRGEQVVGYGYMGKGTGPIALLDGSDFPAVLAHAENDAAERGEREFGISLPLINRAATDHMLEHKFNLEGFVVLFMSDEPFGRFENYAISSPDYFL